MSHLELSGRGKGKFPNKPWYRILDLRVEIHCPYCWKELDESQWFTYDSHGPATECEVCGEYFYKSEAVVTKIPICMGIDERAQS